MRGLWQAFIEGLASLCWSDIDLMDAPQTGSLDDDWKAVAGDLRKAMADFDEQLKQ